MLLENMMYKQGLGGNRFVQHEKSTTGCNSTTQGGIVEMLQTFLGALQQKDKWQWSQIVIREIPDTWKENVPL